MSVWVVVVAAGSGSRFGGPKQYEMMGNTRLVDRSIATAARNSDGVVVVVPVGDVDRERALLVGAGASAIVAGGRTRAGSVRAGLLAVPSDTDVVLVHDAARPLASDDLYARVIAAVERGADAAVPAVAVVDSLRRRGGGAVDRNDFVAVQTPQGFRAEMLRRAHRDQPEASDDATLVEQIGGRVEIVQGEPANFKITTSADLLSARALCSDLS